jgi:hypothetical protein
LINFFCNFIVEEWINTEIYREKRGLSLDCDDAKPCPGIGKGTEEKNSPFCEKHRKGLSEN